MGSTANNPNTAPIRRTADNFILAFLRPCSPNLACKNALLHVVNVKAVCSSFIVSMFG